MQEYLRILKNVLTNGQPKQPTRFAPNGEAILVENETIASFGETFRFNMSRGEFPLLTCRKMPFKSMAVEVEGFIKGITYKKWYQERGCKYWDYWANPVEVQKSLSDAVVDDKDRDSFQAKIDLRKKIQAELTDLGPVYGYQWRKFGQIYDNNGSMDSDGIKYGFDQFKYIVDTLKTNPYDRRMVCSAWNPNQRHLMALQPCHYSFNVVVIGNKLNLVYHMRSVDWILGSNLGLYGLLLTLLSKESGLEPGTLMGTYSDCHIYNNHIANAMELLKKEPLPLPSIEFSEWNGIWNWKAEHTVLKDYVSHPPMKFEVTV
jgi:thymidylate synthase